MLRFMVCIAQASEMIPCASCRLLSLDLEHQVGCSPMREWKRRKSMTIGRNALVDKLENNNSSNNSMINGGNDSRGKKRTRRQEAKS